MKISVVNIVGFRGDQRVRTGVDSVRMDGVEIGLVTRHPGAKISFLQDVDPHLYEQIHAAVSKIRERQGLPPVSNVVLAAPGSELVKQYLMEKEWRRRGMAPEPSSEDPDTEFEETIGDY